jgi:hypothetical protein
VSTQAPSTSGEYLGAVRARHAESCATPYVVNDREHLFLDNKAIEVLAVGGTFELPRQTAVIALLVPFILKIFF